MIRKASFIASSPLAVQYLFSLPKEDTSSQKANQTESVYRQPILQIQILFVHDFVSAFAPYYNKAITNYGIPYQFIFIMFCGKCICQYKQFSYKSLPWLPVIPSQLIQSLNAVFDRQFAFEYRVWAS